MSNELQELYIEFRNEWGINRHSSFHINHVDDMLELIEPSSGWVHGTTMLMAASYYGDTNIVKKCLKLGADVNKMNKKNRIALFFSILSVKYVIIELLLKAGSDPNIKIECDDGIVMPILFYFMRYSSYNIIKYIDLLIQYGALINEFYKYRDHLENQNIEKQNIYHFKQILAKRRWVIIKCVTIALSLHKRAVITANHPDRLKLSGAFEI